MILLILFLAFLSFLLWVGFSITGGLLLGAIWLFIKLPIAIFLCSLALIFCCTIILIPIGILLFKCGLRMLIPGI